MKILVAVILLTSIAGSVGLQCFNCVSGTGIPLADTTACNDPFNTNTTDAKVSRPTCTTGEVCGKITVSASDVNQLARTCYASAGCPEQGGCASGSYGGASATICCCTGNLCNGAGSVTVNFITTVAVISMAMVFTL